MSVRALFVCGQPAHVIILPTLPCQNLAFNFMF